MAHPLPAFALLGFLALMPATAVAADQPPLRTLSYHVEVAIQDKRDVAGGGITGASPMIEWHGRVLDPGTPARGDGDTHLRAGVKSTGDITVRVLAATDDFGLVVDVTEDGSRRQYPATRVAIASTGEMLYDPHHADQISEEERALLRWLARGFFGEHSTAPGTFWTVDQSENGDTTIEHYRVVSSEEHHVTLDYALDEKTPGSDGFSGRREGSLVYDTALVVPVKAGFEEDARRVVGGAYDTMHSSFAFTLLSDSFASRH